jgi:hypothetical protein
MDPVKEHNCAALRRQEGFRLAADYVARAFACIPAVRKIALFGSVAVPLTREAPRRRPLRRAGVQVLHECKDLDRLSGSLTSGACAGSSGRVPMP